MAKIIKCKNCGNKISIREMPNGKWLPFEFQSDELHKCSRTIDEISAKKNSNNLNSIKPKDNGVETAKNPKKLSIIKEAIAYNKNLNFDYTRRTSVGREDISIIPIELIGASKILGFCLPYSGRYTFNISEMKNIKTTERLKSIDEIEYEMKKEIDGKMYSIFDDSHNLCITFKLDGFNGVPIEDKVFITELKNRIMYWIIRLIKSDSNFSKEKYNNFMIMNHFFKKYELLMKMINFDEVMMMYQNQMEIELKEKEEREKIELDKMNIKKMNRSIIILALGVIVIMWWISTSR